MDNVEKNSILVVDDEKLNLEVLNSILSPEYTLYLTKNGSSALNLAEKFIPDLILLDIIMPDMSGFEVLAKLKSSDRTRHIPVIIITGLNKVEDEEEGLALEAADFINKPFSNKVVKSRVRNQMQIIRQIKELKELQKSLEAAVSTAEAANKAKSSFLAKMSHEIRTPLNAVLGISEIHLQSETVPPEHREAFSRIYNSGDLLQGIINDILDMSKIEAGKLELLPSLYDVSSLINDTVFLNMIKFENKPIEFTLNVDKNIPSFLIGDEIRIKQILNNLLSNAFKYTESGQVELSFNAEQQQDSFILSISIRDTGQGMTKEQKDMLFEDYSRFNSEANRSTEGIGLGMGITQNLVQLMNGNIHVESESGKGSVFTVCLPQGSNNFAPLGEKTVEKLLQFRQNHEIKNKKNQFVRYSMSTAKVLVVDDMDMNLYVAKGLLSLYGLQVDTAASGFEAIEKIKNSVTSNNEYDIVFMDHMMPIMDGVETTANIRAWENEPSQKEANKKQTTIVALTANAVSGVKELFLSSGFNGYLSKPINTHELDEVLKQWIPADKIQKSTGPENVNETEELEAFINEVKNNCELDIETGLNNLSGDKNMYRNTLKIFYDDTMLECDNMSAYLKKGDLNNFLIIIHKIKSSLFIIGATTLSATARELENASNNKDIDYCNANFDPFKEKFLLLHNKLSTLFSNEKEAKVSDNVKVKEQVSEKRGKVLLVDDMDMLLYVIKEKLLSYNLFVDTAESGQEAIEKIKNNEYNMVFMDYLMPELDGIETTSKIRQMGPEYEKLPIVVLTANTDSYNKDMFLTKGFNDYLSKPVIKEELEKVLNRWVPE
ncbi:MAG: response regulator [Treponema sp.]|jgi:CheY-like chemotaxis protein/HPt (histidine-containing phosphotransfer) domain-containing protein|nr:response regulator [Treponema sp.]